jgi:hypothetical protein
MTDTPPIVRDLRSFAEAYPEDVFRPLTDADRKEHSVLITRASAQMGRHFGKWATKAADTIEALLAALEALEGLVNGPGEGRVSPSEPDSFERRMDQARAAIAKARGQSI